MGEFFYRVTDDSMSKDRIYPGNKVLIKETTDFAADDILAVACDSDISVLILRRVKKENGRYILAPSNPTHSIEYRETILVIGKLISTNLIV